MIESVLSLWCLAPVTAYHHHTHRPIENLCTACEGCRLSASAVLGCANLCDAERDYAMYHSKQVGTIKNIPTCFKTNDTLAASLNLSLLLLISSFPNYSGVLVQVQ